MPTSIVIDTITFDLEKFKLVKHINSLFILQGNHGEDCKELYYYLDSIPTHSYMKALYKYPQEEYPYAWLENENGNRSVEQPEFEIEDTGICRE